MVRLALLLALAGCRPVPEPEAPTPEEVAATALDGDMVDVSGVVHAFTHDTEYDGSDEFIREPGFWVLMRSADAEPVSRDDVRLDEVFDDDVVLDAWGLGMWIPADAPRPRVGDVARFAGTFRQADWNGHLVPTVEPGVLDAPAHGAGLGDSCTHDEDCDERWVCDRATAACTAPEDPGWGTLWRDVDGHCRADEDCPFGQHCAVEWPVPSSGDHTWRFDGASKEGAALCVPEGDAPASACPEIWRPEDLQSGRFAEGRELCVEGVVQIVTHAADGDTHVQLYVDEPLSFPAVDGWLVPVGHAAFVGATTEIGPPHKSPERPQGAVVDPDFDQPLVAIGTYRWDEDHGWYELHPVKWWWAE